MALVPFRVSGPAASQQLDSQLLQVGPYSLMLHQRPQASGNAAHLMKSRAQQQQQQGEDVEQDRPQQQEFKDRLPNVGFVLWQSGFVLADFLLQRLPQLQNIAQGSSGSNHWAGVRVLEFGCGAGTVGMFLALAGAQVVLTDQSHILSLTEENLNLNFPAAATGAAGAGSSLQKGCRGTPAQQQQPSPPAAAVTYSNSAAAGVVAVNGYASPAWAANSGGLSVAERVTCASDHQAVTGNSQSIQQQLQLEHCQQTYWDVFGPGPLVVEYVWGKPQPQLQGGVAAAAAVRLAQGAPRCATSLCRAAGEAATTTAAATAVLKDAPELDSLVQELAGAEYDVIVGADILYYSDSHQVLLDSLNSLSAPHTQVYMSYRRRGLGEEHFEELAAEAGWLVQVANSSLLHPEFQGGEYRLLCLSRIE